MEAINKVEICPKLAFGYLIFTAIDIILTNRFTIIDSSIALNNEGPSPIMKMKNKPKCWY
jgi:hypothetical protein